MVESFLSEVSGFLHNKGIYFIEFFPYNFIKRFRMTIVIPQPGLFL